MTRSWQPSPAVGSAVPSPSILSIYSIYAPLRPAVRPKIGPAMKRISIEVTDQEQARLKAMAALQGLSIKEFVLSSTIGSGAEAKALEELEALLDARMERARTDGFSKKTVDEIFEDGIAEARPSAND